MKSHKKVHSVNSLSRRIDATLPNHNDAYQEPRPTTIPQVSMENLNIDLGSLPSAPVEFYAHHTSAQNIDEDFDEEGEEEDFE